MTNGSRAADGAADVMARAVELVEAGESFTMATVVWRQAPSSGHHGSRAIVTEASCLSAGSVVRVPSRVLIREARASPRGGQGVPGLARSAWRTGEDARTRGCDDHSDLLSK